MEDLEARSVVVSIKVPALWTFLQLLIASCLVLAIFVLGRFVGQAEHRNLDPVQISVVLPDSLELTGLPNGKTECLDWAMEHFKEVKVGLLSMVCNGR